MVDGDRQTARCCLRQTPAPVAVDIGDQLGLLLARGAHPAVEPLRRQRSMPRDEAPGARADQDLRPEPPELLDCDGHRMRTQQAAAPRQATLVRIKCGGDPAIQSIGRTQLHPADDRQG